jgi:hypothetical protein
MLKRIAVLSAVAAVAVFALTPVASAFPPIAEWTFEVSVPATAGPHAAEGGDNAGPGSPASGLHASASTVYSNPVGNGSNESFSSNFWAIGDYYQFQTSTVGYTDITFSWHQTRSSTGPEMFQLQWSTDGSLFTDLGAQFSVPAITWTSGAPDGTLTTVFGPVSAPAALDNQAAVYFRLVAMSAPSSTAGSNRVDNVVIDGVPEPGTLALVALGALGLIRRRR